MSTAPLDEFIDPRDLYASPPYDQSFNSARFLDYGLAPSLSHHLNSMSEGRSPDGRMNDDFGEDSGLESGVEDFAFPTYASVPGLHSTPSSLSLRSQISEGDWASTSYSSSYDDRGDFMTAARFQKLRGIPCERIEASEKARWACLQCSRTFSKALLLDAHAKEQRHQAYRCGDCNKRYLRQSTLARHRATAHEPRSAHRCGRCSTSSNPKLFRRRDHLQQHLREVHKEVDYAGED